MRKAVLVSGALTLEDFDYSSRVVDEEALRVSADVEPFGKESFIVLRELAQSVSITASIARTDERGQPRLLTRDEAILAGLMVRCARSSNTGCSKFCNPQRMELLNFFIRGVVETAVNLRFLLEKGTPEIFDDVGICLRTRAR